MGPVAGSMKIYYDAAFRSAAFDPTLALGESLPGRELAHDLGRALEEIGQAVREVSLDEPFWVIRVPTEPREIGILVYLYVPAEEGTEPVWAVSVPSTIGWLGRLLGKTEADSIVALLRDLDTVLRRDDRLRDIRWFRELPIDPYEAGDYSGSPVVVG